ncbi:MAG TPA: 3-phosphoshikimate 1-carboxyvinyltransferase [Bryobacteraceae bacterium]|nr:3-phosphoshikimate 1-carboxyvinyltransferase [Bryobacteraceae bacterium]
MGDSATIEIVPPSVPVTAEVSIPGSKSLTNRALILAALSDGEIVLNGALWSEDTEVMSECLRKLQIPITIHPDPGEPANRTITVRGTCGSIARGGTVEAPLELFVGNAGTAARFLAALVCLGQGVYRLSGVARMHERPQAALFRALRDLGYRIDSPNDRLPALIHGSGPREGAKCRVGIDQSSQFASALLLVGPRGGWEVIVEGNDSEAAPYAEMTRGLVKAFPPRGAFPIEPDASSASYFWGAGWLLGSSSRIRVANWMAHSVQIDARFPEYLRIFPERTSRRYDLGDSIMSAIVLAPFADVPKLFVDLETLRLQECERVQALHTELSKCGARVVENGQTLRIEPGPLHGATIETYGDHRMAMCFAMLGLRVPGMRIRNPACVKKTFPNFFEKLATAPPEGLGVELRAPTAA